MIKIYYPLGAGGNWLRSTLESVPLEQNKLYVNFHGVRSVAPWVQIGHLGQLCDNGLVYSGTCYFNFFVNHVYKYYHHVQDLFNTTTYKQQWMTIVAAAFEICKANIYVNNLAFNFDELLCQPEKFYESVAQVQSKNLQPVLSYEEFTARREKFLDSCVNVDGMLENFDNMIWTAFVLGQLMTQNIHPEFSIGDKQNQQLCREFAKQHYHRCQLKNVFSANSQVCLPEFKNLL